MPQLVVLALVGAGLYAGYRWFTRTTKEIRSKSGAPRTSCPQSGGHRAGKGNGRAGIRSPRAASTGPVRH